MRILIGIPCYDKVAPEVLEDYMRFAYYLGRHYTEHEFILGIKTKSEQFRARNSIVEGAYQLAADYLLFLDDDMIIDWEGVNYPTEKYEFLRKLLKYMEEDPKLGLIGALYFHRGGQCKPVLLKEDGGGGFRYLRDDELLGGYQEVAIQGGGCMLIRMKALDFVGAPWFQAEIEQGTDFQICRKLWGVGYKVASDTSIELGHVSSEMKIITSQNRHVVQAESTALAKSVEMSAMLRPIYESYRKDIMEYLGVDKIELIKLADKYQEHRKTFEADKPETYYRNGGRPYLARAALIATLDKSLPGSWDDFLLKTLRQGVPAIGVDFGCGAGRISYEFARSGHMMYFIDLDGVSTFEFLKDRLKKNDVAACLNIWPIDNSADYVLASDSIEHLNNFDILEKIYQCLKPSGVFLCNYLMCMDWKNQEHILNDKPGFLKKLKDVGFVTVNSAVFQKMAVS